MEEINTNTKAVILITYFELVGNSYEIILRYLFHADHSDRAI
jgi:hypothetical protein